MEIDPNDILPPPKPVDVKKRKFSSREEHMIDFCYRKFQYDYFTIDELLKHTDGKGDRTKLDAFLKTFAVSTNNIKPKTPVDAKHICDGNVLIVRAEKLYCVIPQSNSLR